MYVYEGDALRDIFVGHMELVDLDLVLARTCSTRSSCFVYVA